MAEFDHLAVSAANLATAVEEMEALLGIRLDPGGRHPHMSTHNRLLSLGPGEYLEVISADPDVPPPAHPRWFALDRFSGPPRLTNWVVRVDDLDVALADAPEGAGRATDLARGVYRWRMGIPDDGELPFGGGFPALIEWTGESHPASTLPDRGCRLTRLEIMSPVATALQDALPLGAPRIVVIPGPSALRAFIETPQGEKVLA